MTSPRFIGIRDVIDPYKGLQDSVAKVGDIYRQYNKDAQEAERIRNQEARENKKLDMEEERLGFDKERLGFDRDRIDMDRDRMGFDRERIGFERTAHQIAADERAEQQRIKDVIRNFDPYQTIENYGINEKFVRKFDELDQQVWDYHNRKTFDTQEEAEQARRGVENSLRALRGGARDRDVAKRQYIEHLRRQGVPIERAVVLAEASTSGYGSHAEMAADLQKQAEATDKFNVDASKAVAPVLAAVIRATSSDGKSSTGSSTRSASDAGSDVIKENFDAFKITPDQQQKAIDQFAEVIGNGASIMGVRWSGDARRTVNDITAAVNAINNEVLKHNEQAWMTPGAEIRQLVDFEDAVGWVGSTAKVGSDVEFTNYGSVKTFIEDMASRRDTSEVANRARVADAKQQSTKLAEGVRQRATTTATGEGLTGEDIKSVMPQRSVAYPVEQVVLDRIKSSYATMFPGAFPQAASVSAPTTAAAPRPEDEVVNTRTDSETNDRGIPPPAGGEPNNASRGPNIIGGTRTVVPKPEQPPQPISREVLLPFNEPKTSSQVDINSAVTRLAEIQTILAGPSLGWGGKKELRQEAETIRNSLKQLPGSDRILEATRTNARQARLESEQTQATAQEEQKRRERMAGEVQQIRERLADIVSPTVRRIDEDRLQQLLEVYPDL